MGLDSGLLLKGGRAVVGVGIGVRPIPSLAIGVTTSSRWAPVSRKADWMGGSNGREDERGGGRARGPSSSSVSSASSAPSSELKPSSSNSRPPA
jgi:hypothetical protein